MTVKAKRFELFHDTEAATGVQSKTPKRSFKTACERTKNDRIRAFKVLGKHLKGGNDNLYTFTICLSYLVILSSILLELN